MKNIVVLGSTGSIGESTIRILEEFPEKFHTVALVANRRLNRLVEQGRSIQAERLITADLSLKEELQTAASNSFQVGAGEDAITKALEQEDCQWAAELCDVLINSGQELYFAREKKAQSLLGISRLDTSATGRHYYITCARELEAENREQGGPKE